MTPLDVLRSKNASTPVVGAETSEVGWVVARPCRRPALRAPFRLVFGDGWAAMLVAEDVSPPEPGELRGLAFCGATHEEAERGAKKYLGLSEPVNRLRGGRRRLEWTR